MALLEVITTTLKGVRGLSRAAVNAAPVDEATLARRRSTCANCGQATRTQATHIQSLRVLTPTSTCSACHCNIKAKTKLADEACPLDLW